MNTKYPSCSGVVQMELVRVWIFMNDGRCWMEYRIQPALRKEKN